MGELVDLFAQGLQIGQRQAEAESRQEFREVQMEQAQQEMARMRQAASPEVAQAFMDVHDIDKSPAELREAWSLLFPHKYLLTLAGSGRDTLLKQREQIEKENRQQKLKIKLVEEELKLKDKFGDENATEKYERDTLNYLEAQDVARSMGATDETIERLYGGISEDRREGFRTNDENVRASLKDGKVLSGPQFRNHLTDIAQRAFVGAGLEKELAKVKGDIVGFKKERRVAFQAAVRQMENDYGDTPKSQLDRNVFNQYLHNNGFYDDMEEENVARVSELIMRGGARDGGDGDDVAPPLTPTVTADTIMRDRIDEFSAGGKDNAARQIAFEIMMARDEDGKSLYTNEAKARLEQFIETKFSTGKRPSLRGDPSKVDTPLAEEAVQEGTPGAPPFEGREPGGNSLMNRRARGEAIAGAGGASERLEPKTDFSREPVGDLAGRRKAALAAGGPTVTEKKKKKFAPKETPVVRDNSSRVTPKFEGRKRDGKSLLNERAKKTQPLKIVARPDIQSPTTPVPESKQIRVSFKTTGNTKGDRKAALAAGHKSLGSREKGVLDLVLGLSQGRINEAQLGILEIDSESGTAVLFLKAVGHPTSFKSGSLLRRKAQKEQ